MPIAAEPPAIEEVTYTVIADSSWRTFGRHGDQDVAEFARREDWWARRPTVKEALAVLDYAVYEGGLIVDGGKPMTWETGTGELELYFHIRDSVESKKTRAARVLFPRSGAAEVIEQAP